MPGFFSVRLAPGVRISASPRGLRAHVGPRLARVHMGGGRTGVSTGAGPATWYQPVGGSSRRSSRAPGPTSGQIAAAQKEQQAQLVTAALAAIETLHHAEYPPPSKPDVPPPWVPDHAALLAKTTAEQLRGIRLLDVSGRRAARDSARVSADEAYRRQAVEAQAAWDERRRDVDAFWRQFTEGDPQAVVCMLDQVFADNEAPATALGMERGEIQLAVLVPRAQAVIPDRAVGATPAGGLSVKQMPKRDFFAWDRALVAGHVLATAKEALATVPGAHGVAVVALRDQGPDVYGAPQVLPILAVRLSRTALHGVQWRSAYAWNVVAQAGTDLKVNLYGASQAPAPLKLDKEPDLRTLVDEIDLTALAGAS